jgi:hypothetical protein
MLLVLASAVILRSESRGTHDHNLLPHNRHFPNLEGQAPYLYPSGIGWLGYTPRHWVPFSSPPTTRRVTVEVFGPASTRGTDYALNLISLISPWQGPRRKHSSSLAAQIISMVTCLSAMESPSNGRVYLLIKNLLPRNGCHSAICFEAVA